MALSGHAFQALDARVRCGRHDGQLGPRPRLQLQVSRHHRGSHLPRRLPVARQLRLCDHDDRRRRHRRLRTRPDALCDALRHTLRHQRAPARQLGKARRHHLREAPPRQGAAGHGHRRRTRAFRAPSRHQAGDEQCDGGRDGRRRRRLFGKAAGGTRHHPAGRSQELSRRARRYRASDGKALPVSLSERYGTQGTQLR